MMMRAYHDSLPSSSSLGYDGDGKQRSRKQFPPQSLTPVTVRQLATAQQADEGFLVDGRIIQQVTLVGSYRTPRRVGTTLRFFLNDGTGELPCVVSTDMNARMAELWEQLQEHSHVRLFGKLKDDKSLTLFHAQAIQDHAEVVYHELDAIYHHFAATIPARRPPARAMFPLPTATAGAAAPPYGGTPSHYTVPHAPYNSFTHTSPQFGQGSMVRVGAGSLLQPGPAPSSSSPSAFQPSTSWALPSQASVRPGEVELRSAIRSAIRQSRDSHGASVQSIDQQLTRFNLTDIRKELHQMGVHE